MSKTSNIRHVIDPEVFEDAQTLICLTTETIEVVDHKTLGKICRERREEAEVSLRCVAGSMGISAPYLSDLERGRRNWTVDRLVDFLRGVKALS